MFWRKKKSIEVIEDKDEYIPLKRMTREEYSSFGKQMIYDK